MYFCSDWRRETSATSLTYTTLPPAEWMMVFRISSRSLYLPLVLTLNDLLPARRLPAGMFTASLWMLPMT